MGDVEDIDPVSLKGEPFIYKKDKIAADRHSVRSTVLAILIFRLNNRLQNPNSK